MAEIWDFIVVGSGGGGGTIAWLLAKAGRKVLLLEQGPDYAGHLHGSPELGPATAFNSALHDEFGWYSGRPDPVRRLRGAYNTFRDLDKGGDAAPFLNGWTASMVGGASGVWGTWTYRAFPVDFQIADHFARQKLDGITTQLEWLNSRGYSIVNWPIYYKDLAPYYDIAEALLAVSGDRQQVNRSIEGSDWFQWLKSEGQIGDPTEWLPSHPFPGRSYPITPVGHFVAEAIEQGKFVPAPLSTSIVTPAANADEMQTDPGYLTRDYLNAALERWRGTGPVPSFWRKPIEDLWSTRYRQRCTLCGFCGGYLCWGAGSPKSGALATTLLELRDIVKNAKTAEIRPNSCVYEIITDPQKKRALGVRYLDVSNPDAAAIREERARNVIVSGGAVQSARLLLMSGDPGGLGNEYGQVGANATFHLFGLEAKIVLSKTTADSKGFTGLLHGEFGHTGNTTSLGTYFLQDTEGVTGFKGSWWKAGTLASTARKNPLAEAKIASPFGLDMLGQLSKHERALNIRMTGDDLPRPTNRITLDPKYVDEYGLPVARIERRFGDNETKALFPLTKATFRQMLKPFEEKGVFDGAPVYSDATLNFVADHQFGTCRMGDDPKTSVVDRNCRVHGWSNVFVVDSSVMTSGLGLNPMLTVVANALRVGTWMTENASG